MAQETAADGGSEINCYQISHYKKEAFLNRPSRVRVQILFIMCTSRNLVWNKKSNPFNLCVTEQNSTYVLSRKILVKRLYFIMDFAICTQNGI